MFALDVLFYPAVNDNLMLETEVGGSAPSIISLCETQTKKKAERIGCYCFHSGCLMSFRH